MTDARHRGCLAPRADGIALAFVFAASARAPAQEADSSGNRATIQVLRPTQAQVDSSEYGHYLREFIDVTRNAIERDRFTPAHIGRCAVRETVQLPVSYAFRRN